METQTKASTALPRIRDNLTIREVSATEYVVKRNDSREYFSLGRQEACLLNLLDGQHTLPEIQNDYRNQFDDELSEADLKEFIEAVRPMGLFQPGRATSATAGMQAGAASEQSGAAQAVTESDQKKKKRTLLQDQSLLFFRIPLFDPDHSLTRIVRWFPFIWSRRFVIVASCIMLAALSVMTSNTHELAAGIQAAPGWGNAILFIVVMLACTSLHEVAHGATLKFYGGEVHDTGVLFMFFTPCLYCNVSDAWLIPDKWKRLAVTGAGGFCDLCTWAAGVFLWRLTVPGTTIHTIAFMALTICGGRSLLNFNPLLRLDGYYLLSDWLSIPNLRPRAMNYWMGHVRWALWGGARPSKVPEARPLLCYGFLCWCFAFVFLDVIFVRFFSYMGGQFGGTGLIFVALLLSFAFRRVFKGFFSSEFGVMLKSRPRRTATWAAGLLTAVVLLFFVPVRSTTNGDFEIRPGNVVQVHIPVAGIVENVFVEDGSEVKEGQLLAELKSPSLDVEIAKTEDLLHELEANLRKLTGGAREEELTAAADRLRRLTEWHELGIEELQQARVAHEQLLLVQDHRINEIKAQLENIRQNLKHSEHLYRQRALAGAQLRQEQLQLVQMESQLAQTEASLSAVKAIGVRSKEAEISRRAQELEDARDRLKLLEAGTRVEEISAEAARHERVKHELAYLRSQKEKLQLKATATGIFGAPRLKERIGLAVALDSLFCTIEQPETSRVEIAVSEDEAAHLREGQAVSLKARAIPFETFDATVEGISATAQKLTPTGNSVVLVHCQIENPDGRLKSGMTGFGRISRGWNTIGTLMLTKGVRYLRTEFWW